MILILFVVFAFASSVIPSSALNGCPAPPATPGVDIDKILGLWYVSTPTILSNVTLDFRPREDEDWNLTVSLFHRKNFHVDLLAERTDNQNLLNIYADQSKKLPVPMKFNIIDTDYDNYLVAYTCLILPMRSIHSEPLNFTRTHTVNAYEHTELPLVDVSKE